MARYVFSFFLLVLAASCSDKYQAFRSRYSFSSADGKPDYSQLDYWAAHPSKWDPSDSIPAPLKNEQRDTAVDIFFLHPTTYTRKIRSNNARIDDDYLNAKTDYSSILYQSSVFNQHGRVFSPRYRQASIKVFFMKDEEISQKAFDLAYGDIRTAFEYYLQHWNKGRPIIIAGHSQGSRFARQLLKDYFEDKPLQKQLVVAYIPGWPVSKDFFTSIRMCADSLQTGCVCSWRTLRNGYLPCYLVSEKGNAYVTNPLTWTMDAARASRKLNGGSVLFKFNKIYKHTTDGRISNGLLYVRHPRFPWSFLYLKRNYHVGDINLFYVNIRRNVEQRIRSFAQVH